MADTITIDRRYCGPPDSGNGGYVCGRLAAYTGEPAQVRLLAPPPLGVELEVRRTPSGVELVHAGNVVAWARPAEVALEAPRAPGYDAAVAAARHYRGFRAHPFPTCFVCGPDRAAGDGLRIFPGKLAGSDLVASPWNPDASLADDQGIVRREFLWSALDCPGAFSFDVPDGTAVLLGEFAAQVSGPVRAGERCVVIGWELGREGRKHLTASALYSASGECRGVARATWFEMRTPAPAGS
jgi:hypothetical protein